MVYHTPHQYATNNWKKRWAAEDERKERWREEARIKNYGWEKKRWRWFREWRRAVKQRMEDLASLVALVGKASPLLPDKRWPGQWCGMVLIGWAWSPAERAVVLSWSSVHYRDAVGYFVLDSYSHGSCRVLNSDLSYSSSAPASPAVHNNRSPELHFFRPNVWL